jgi:hypothetical protein
MNVHELNETIDRYSQYLENIMSMDIRDLTQTESLSSYLIDEISELTRQIQEQTEQEEQPEQDSHQLHPIRMIGAMLGGALQFYRRPSQIPLQQRLRLPLREPIQFQPIFTEIDMNRLNPLNLNQIFGLPNNPPRGEDQIPAIKYDPSNSDHVKFDSCTVCQSDFVTNDDVRLLPCEHIFHVGCIDPWFERSSVCPTCRFDVSSQS